MNTFFSRVDRQVVQGLIFVGLICLIVAGTVAHYQGAFESRAIVSVETDRAGLTLAKGAPVKIHGVEIGAVGAIDLEGDDVTISLELDPDEIGDVPADVTAQIVPPTAFGAKYVQLTAPGGSSGVSIRAGAVIPATRVTVEIDEAFENLTQVLDVARPAEVDAALTALAGAVEGRGRTIGELVSQTDRYLAGLNPALPQLAEDLRRVDGVIDVYDAARPDLIGTLAQTADISDTLVRQQASLRALHRSLTTFSDEAGVLLRSSEKGIVTSLEFLEPVARTAERYAPELPCLILGLASVNKLTEKALGGDQPGLSTTTRLIPARDAYTFEENLPQLGEDRGPDCFGLPYVTPAEARRPQPELRTGANPDSEPRSAPDQAALDTLLKLLSGGVNAP